MNDTMTYIICGLAIMLLICLIALQILFARQRKIDKEIEQCEKIAEILTRNPDISDEEIMKMDMPKDLRKELEKTMRKKYDNVQSNNKV